jgi:hypothetical protein
LIALPPDFPADHGERFCVMTQFTGTVTLSIDDDGFLRRECPSCEREFKWLHGEQGEPVPEGGYHCPYCDGRSEDGWWTRPQLAHIQAKVAAHGEELVHNELKELEKSSSAFMKVTVSGSRGRAIPPVPAEPNDMTRVDFVCHPTEPAKVLDSWANPVHCLICGAKAGP